MADVSKSMTRDPLSTISNEQEKMPMTPPLGHSPVKPVRGPNTMRRTIMSEHALAEESLETSQRVGLFAVDDRQAFNDCEHTIICPKSIGLLFGRARALNETDNEEVPSEYAPQAQENTVSTNGVPVRRIMLPNSARHVSRDHCIIYHTPFGGNAWAVKILGQNGLIVDKIRHRPGSIVRITPGQSVLDFFGVRCLFVGQDGEQKSKDVAVDKRGPPVMTQDGRSPSKANALPLLSPTSAEQQLRSAVSGVAVVGTKKFVGNAQKRPLGAPVSPPTSSPVPFELQSSPIKRTGLPASSPMSIRLQAIEDDDDEEEEEDQSPSRGLSPSLQRRSVQAASKQTNRNDDSGVFLHETEAADAKQAESDDEASQILAVSAKVQDAHQAKRSRKRSANVAVNVAQDVSRSNTASPRPAHRGEVKRVKFSAGNNQSSSQSTPTSATGKSVAVLASTMQAIQTHYRSLVGQLANTYDLQGLLAGAIVFHRTATISATEAVRSVLTSNPGLMRGEVGPEGEVNDALQRGSVITGWTLEEVLNSGTVKQHDAVDKERVEIWQRKAWRECLEACLMEGECFGIIQRAGKDASGNPLEFWYYYDKEQDPDVQRAANLGAFVKPMRAALKSHKPIFWRKSAYGTTSDDVKAIRDGVADTSNALGSTTAGATESQWGSSGSTLKAAILSGEGASANGGGAKAGLDLMIKSAAKASSSSTTNVVMWEETQVEEDEQTWDREGDMDFELGSTSRRATKRRK